MKAIEDLKMICGILDQLKLTRVERGQLDAATNRIWQELLAAQKAGAAANLAAIGEECTSTCDQEGQDDGGTGT